MKVEIYTDGSSSKPPLTAGGFAAMMYVDGVLIQSIKGGAYDTSNNKMELAGIIAAMTMVPSLEAYSCQDCGPVPFSGPGGTGWEGLYFGQPFSCDAPSCMTWKKTKLQVPMYSDVTIYSDSEYCVKGASFWVDTWLNNGWATTAKQPVKNRELWEQVVALRNLCQPKFQWVKGHVGHDKNEKADALAGQARYQTIKGGPGVTEPGLTIYGVDWVQIIE